MKNIYDEITNAIPQIKRGMVWCKKCGRDQSVKNGLRNGWPVCCGETMTIDSPEERQRLAMRIPNPPTP